MNGTVAGGCAFGQAMAIPFAGSEPETIQSGDIVIEFYSSPDILVVSKSCLDHIMAHDPGALRSGLDTEKVLTFFTGTVDPGDGIVSDFSLLGGGIRLFEGLCDEASADTEKAHLAFLGRPIELASSEPE